MEQIKAAFLNPQDEFTPIPFWFWNDALDEKEIIRQIRDFNEKGVRGFVIHPRIGIPKETQYLSDLFMELVTCAVEEADRLGMKVVLYDEAMYPSGSAHGMVVKNHPDYASKALKMTEYPCAGTCKITIDEEEFQKLVSVQAVQRLDDQKIRPDSIIRLERQINLPDGIRRLEVKKNEIMFQAEEGENWSVLLFTEVYTNGHIRGIHFGEDDGEAEAPASSDLLNKAAMEEFIRLTHDRYYEVLGHFFGNTIIGMFTDEPGIMGRGDMKGLIPWTGGFLNYYLQQGGSETDLPLLWLDAGEASAAARRKYEEAVNKRMEESYYKPIHDWCEAHQIALTGHPEKSDDIGFLKYFHIPAQDVVWRWVAPEDGLALQGGHSTMAKCTSDSARHRGMRRNGNECFACCGKDRTEWAFSADDMKWYMDWLFVRGVNLLYPHAFFYSIDGPRRLGERPPDVGPNNIWWPYYKQISDYIKRMCYMLTDCVNQARVAVLCESHHLPWRIVKPLYENQVEFNYLELELFQSEECRIQESLLNIANQNYQVLLIEDIELLNEEKSSKLQRFIDHGGTVIVYNPLLEELPIRNAKNITEESDTVSRIRQTVVADLILEKPARDLRVTHLVKNEVDFYLFVNEGEETIHSPVKLSMVGSVEIWDACKGAISAANIISCEDTKPGSMVLELNLNRRETLFVCVNQKETPIVAVNDVNTLKTDMKVMSEILIPGDSWYMGLDKEKLEKIDALIPWNEVDGMQHYSGSVYYRTYFNITSLDGYQEADLRLGTVDEIADVTLNGQALGVQMWAPYTFPATDAVRIGDNELIVEVRNTLANKIMGKSYSSGLLGPVSLILY